MSISLPYLLKQFSFFFSHSYRGCKRNPDTLHEIVSPPELTSTWENTTRNLIEKRWTLLSPISRKMINVLSVFGSEYPDCSTLEILTRSVVRAHEIQPPDLMDIFARLQKKSEALGMSPVVQLPAFAVLALPFIQSFHLPKNENAFLEAIALLMPVVILGSIGKSKQRDPFGQSMRPNTRDDALNVKYGREFFGYEVEPRFGLL